MQNEIRPNVRFVQNGDGTVTDKSTGLMWTETLYGKGPDGLPCEWRSEDDAGLTFSEATKFFGKGRTVFVPASPRGGPGTPDLVIRGETYKGYVFADLCPIFTGGHNDWRLPTVEEAWTLAEEKKTYRLTWVMVQEPFARLDLEKIWRLILRTATLSGRHGARGEWNSWTFMSVSKEAEAGLHHEHYHGEKYSVRLVRGGKVFNSIYGHRPGNFLIKNNKFMADAEGYAIEIDKISRIEPIVGGILLAWLFGTVAIPTLIVLLIALSFGASLWYLAGFVVISIIALAVIDGLREKSMSRLEIIESGGNKFVLKYDINSLRLLAKMIKKRMRGDADKERGEQKVE